MRKNAGFYFEIINQIINEPTKKEHLNELLESIMDVYELQFVSVL